MVKAVRGSSIQKQHTLFRFEAAQPNRSVPWGKHCRIN
jgi:hypothetical protein